MSAPAAELGAWYAAAGRQLPWRQTRDPYRILVSETMLQQTQVARVVPFYQRFLVAFPDPATLAQAGDDALHRAWKGLGYPSRAERLRAACAQITAAGGVWPETPEALVRLPGIGPYTAGAVACFAFARAVPVVDTNVARVFARRDGLADLSAKALWRHAELQVDHQQPIAYTNALMDLGALVCTARAPSCGTCPWRQRCRANGDPERHEATAAPLKVASRTRRYGVREPVRGKPRRRVVLGLIHHQGRYLVARRPRGVSEAGRWELPGGKREAGEDDRTALARELAEELAVELLAARPFVSFLHDAGERYLDFRVYRCRLFDPEAARPQASEELRWVTPAQFLALDFPAANRPIRERFAAYHRLAVGPAADGAQE